jgi:regulator of sirC expression with transglutaminase-like and TPR domain
MLANLKGIYVRAHDRAKVLAVFDRLLLLDPEAPEHLRDRGTVLVKLGDLHGGALDWERYLRACPAATDADAVKHHLRQVRQRLGSLN